MNTATLTSKATLTGKEYAEALEDRLRRELESDPEAKARAERLFNKKGKSPVYIPPLTRADDPPIWIPDGNYKIGAWGYSCEKVVKNDIILRLVEYTGAPPKWAPGATYEIDGRRYECKKSKGERVRLRLLPQRAITGGSEE